MTHLYSLLMLAAVYLAVLASPGPNLFILSQLSLDGRKREARWTVLGLVTGSLFWVLLSIIGLSTLLASHPMVNASVRMLGAAYLVWYGWMLLRSAFATVKTQRAELNQTDELVSAFAAYRVGLMTGITNPKGAAFWTSAFATLLPNVAPPWFHVAVVVLVTLISLCWHLGITVVFGLPLLRSRYLRVERAVNSVAGGALVLLGTQRIISR